MRRRSLFLLVASVVVVLVAAEAVVRLIEPGLSSAGAWPKGRIAEQFDAVSMRAEERPVDVVFAGSSMMQKAADPKLFTKLTGSSSFNAALPASTNFMLEPWLMDVVVPMLRPRVVVIGVASRDFNDKGSGPDRALRIMLGSPGYRSRVADDWLTDLDRTTSRYSALLRSRRSLRDPTNVLDALGRHRPPVPKLRCPVPSRVERYRVDRTVSRYPKTVLKDFDAGGIQTRALIDAIKALERDGIEVVLAKLAASPEYPELHPHGARDIASHEAALARVIEATDVDVFDATSLSKTRYFRDPIHLNCAGTERFTAGLAASGLVPGTSVGERRAGEP